MLAQAASIRPSEILAIDAEEEPWVAYCVDRAVNTFGIAVQNDMDAVEGKTRKEQEAKRQRVIDRYMPPEGGPKFRDPARKTS